MLSRPPINDHHKQQTEIAIARIEIDFPTIGAKQFRNAQKEDPGINKIIEENASYYTNRGYILIDGVLYRYYAEEDSEYGQIVIPKSLRQQIQLSQ